MLVTGSMDIPEALLLQCFEKLKTQLNLMQIVCSTLLLKSQQNRRYEQKDTLKFELDLKQ